MAGEIVQSTTSNDQLRYLAAKLISRAHLKLVAASVCDPVKLPQGHGDTAEFIRYNRMNLPQAKLTEMTDPATYTSFTISKVTVTLDQWGEVMALSDRVKLTTYHSVVQQAIELLSENAQRVIDREIQLVWLANTNAQYGDGGAGLTSRSAVTAGTYLTDQALHKARVGLVDAGVPPRGGPSGVVVGSIGEGSGAQMKGGMKGIGSAGGGSINQGRAYVAICGAQVIADIMQAGTSLGTFVSVAMYASQKQLYNAEVGTWLGVRFVETNFIPKFSRLGNDVAAVATGNAFGTGTPVVTAVDGGGTLTSGATYYYKVTRKAKSRGFEEDISLEHTTAAAAVGNNESFTFNFAGLSSDYVYNVYFGSATGDANLKLASENVEAGTTVTVTAVPASTTTAPAVPASGVVVHPIYVHGDESCNYVSLQNLEVMMSKDEATTHNPLKLKSTIGYKFWGKAMVRDTTRILRVEVASRY